MKCVTDRLDEGLNGPHEGKVGIPSAARPFESVEHFYAASAPGLVRLASGLLGSVEDGREAVQDVFARLIPRWDRIDTPAAYARRAVVNECRSRSRRFRTASRRRSLAVSAAAAEQEHLELLDVLATLPYKQRAVLVFRYYADLPDAEIAQILGVSRGTVASLGARALKSIRRKVSPDEVF